MPRKPKNKKTKKTESKYLEKIQIGRGHKDDAWHQWRVRKSNPAEGVVFEMSYLINSTTRLPNPRPAGHNVARERSKWSAWNSKVWKGKLNITTIHCTKYKAKIRCLLYSFESRFQDFESTKHNLQIYVNPFTISLTEVISYPAFIHWTAKPFCTKKPFCRINIFKVTKLLQKNLEISGNWCQMNYIYYNGNHCQLLQNIEK